MCADVRSVAGCRSGIDDEVKRIRCQAIDNQVINDGSPFGQQKILTAGAGLLVTGRPQKQAVQVVRCARSGNTKLPHMATVKNRRMRSRVLMFCENSAAVLDGHVPPGERDNTRTDRDVPFFNGQRKQIGHVDVRERLGVLRAAHTGCCSRRP